MLSVGTEGQIQTCPQNSLWTQPDNSSKVCFWVLFLELKTCHCLNCSVRVFAKGRNKLWKKDIFWCVNVLLSQSVLIWSWWENQWCPQNTRSKIQVHTTWRSWGRVTQTIWISSHLDLISLSGQEPSEIQNRSSQIWRLMFSLILLSQVLCVDVFESAPQRLERWTANHWVATFGPSQSDGLCDSSFTATLLQN